MNIIKKELMLFAFTIILLFIISTLLYEVTRMEGLLFFMIVRNLATTLEIEEKIKEL